MESGEPAFYDYRAFDGTAACFSSQVRAFVCPHYRQGADRPLLMICPDLGTECEQFIASHGGNHPAPIEQFAIRQRIRGGGGLYERRANLIASAGWRGQWAHLGCRTGLGAGARPDAIAGQSPLRQVFRLGRPFSVARRNGLAGWSLHAPNNMEAS